MNPELLRPQRRPVPAGLGIAAACLLGLVSVALAVAFGGPVATDRAALAGLTHGIESLDRDRQSLTRRLNALDPIEAVPLARRAAAQPVAESVSAKRVDVKVPVLRIVQREVSPSAARLEHLQRLHAAGRVDESVRQAREWMQSDALDASVSRALERLIQRSGYALPDAASPRRILRARQSEATP